MTIVYFILFLITFGIFLFLLFKTKKQSTEQIYKNNYSQKKNKNLFIILTIIVILFISVGLILSIIFKYKSQTSATVLYKIIYHDDGIPGSKYDISIFDNKKIKIVETPSCSANYCGRLTTEKEVFDYSEDNFEKLKTFINNNFSNNSTELYRRDLTDRQRKMIDGILLGEYFFEISFEEYEYKIEYSVNDNLSYDIYLKNDNSILVKKLKINDSYDIVNIDTYSLDFSQKNKIILNDYIVREIKRNKKDKENSLYKNSTLRKDEINIFNSIIKNDESYLSNIESAAKLSYIISYDGINCNTPTLYLYSDNTYEYYDTFNTNNGKLIPKTGVYNYDIIKLISNIDKYEENYYPYSIIDENGNNYVTYNTNIELKELLSSLNITLEKCLVYDRSTK